MADRMKDYPDRMTVEQAMAFGEDVLSIVSQIPRGEERGMMSDE